METLCSKPRLPIALNGKLVDVIECTPKPTLRKAPVVHEPVETLLSKPHLPIASNGKLVDVIECTLTRLRPQHQPTQNTAIQEKGKFVSHITPRKFYAKRKLIPGKSWW